ncbi:MAG: signal peptide peptidase SppA [Phycisphaerae bacterium]
MSTIRVRSIAVMLAFLPAPFAASGQVTEEPKKVAHFHLTGVVTETPQEDPFGFMSGQMTSLKDLLRRLSEARMDPSIRGVVVTMSNLSMGLAQVEELRNELDRFKAVDKRVFVHVDSLTMGSYALLSSASDLSVVPTADLWLHGLYAEGLYAKNLLEKLGCQADIVHIGDYKSAGEILTRTGPSEEARANIDWLLDGLYAGMVDMIADGRDMSPDQVRRLIDDGPYTAERALKAGLIDSVMYRDEFVENVKKIFGESVTIDNRYAEKSGLDIDISNPFAMFSIIGELLGGGKKKAGRDSIGIVYVEGVIVPGYAEPSPFGGSSGAYSGNIREALIHAAEDDSVKAVVLRVDSPGGSALASEIIWHATQKVRAKKPIIVSMGNVAGSGGYYVSCGADAIFADETTITASIGVVGGKIITTGMWDKIGISWVPYQRGKNADLMNSLEPFDDEQRARITGWMDEIYGVFKEHVQRGRGDKLTKDLEELAGGRVFTGRQALDNGLVDKIGGLHDAIEFAARKASISDYEVRVIPESKSFLDMLFQEMTGKGDRPTDISVRMPLRLSGQFSPLFDTVLPLLNRLEPLRAKALMRGIQRIELLRKERVITMMPTEIIIR